MHKNKVVDIVYYYQRLRDLREDEEKKQSEIAKVLGISQQYYSRYEKGEVEIPFHYVITLAELYNVSIDYIAGKTNDKRRYW